MASDWSIEVDGVFKNLNDDLDFLVTTSFGTGMPRINNLLSPMALQPGSIFEGQNIQSRPFRLRGSIVAEGSENKTDVHDKRQAIAKAISSFRTSASSQLPTRRLRYSGATVTKDIYAVYDGGLEDEPPTGWSQEDMDLRFIAPDPLFYATSETTTALDSNDTATIYGWFGRKSGQWSNLDDPGAPGTAVYTSVDAIVSDSTYIYVAGNFLSFDNIAGADHIVRYNKSTGAYSALGSGLNDFVRDMVIDSSGDLIVVGSFANAGGVANADGIAKWNGTAFSALGVPAPTNTVSCVDIAPNGDIYFGGAFNNLGSVPNADKVGYWDLSASAYAALGTGADGAVEDIVVDSQSNVYITGQFNNANSVAVAKIAKWNGTTFEVLGAGLNDTGLALNIDASGVLYVGGEFTTAGGVTVNYITKWNGTAFSALGAGTDNDVTDIISLTNGDIVACGNFTSAGTLSDLDARLATWNGSSWVHVNFNFTSGAPGLTAVYNEGNDIFAGGASISGLSSEFAGKTTEAYTGTAVSYPYITIARSGGTTATIRGIVNYETSARLLMDYKLLDGETITIEARPQEGVNVTSSLFGNVPSAMLPGSNHSQFYLTPGNASGNNNNDIYAFVAITGAPTITTNIIYKSAYISLD